MELSRECVECGEDSKQIRMQTVRREEYIKANRLERTASTWSYRRPAAALAFIFNIQVNMLNALYFLWKLKAHIGCFSDFLLYNTSALTISQSENRKMLMQCVLATTY